MATDDKRIVTVRISRATIEQVRQIAARESETTSTIYRRLIRRGLAQLGDAENCRVEQLAGGVR